MAFHRGMDGSVLYGGTAIAQLESWSLNADLEELDTTVMGDAWKTVVGGQGSWRGNCSFKIDLGSASQSTLASALLVASPAGTTATVVMRVSSTKTFTGSALFKNIQITSQLGQIVRGTADFTGSGQLVSAWA